LKQTNLEGIFATCVAPCVGAWIETFSASCHDQSFIVAPCVGAWIETANVLAIAAVVSSRALRGRVD